MDVLFSALSHLYVAPLRIRLAVVRAHDGNLFRAALMKATAARLASEALKQQLPAHVTER